MEYTAPDFQIRRSNDSLITSFEFIRSLNLKAVLFICEEDYAADNIAFLKSEGIQLFHIRTQGNKEPFVEIRPEDIQEALERVMDPMNHPILLHCNKGKHRVGCVVGCLRKYEKWSLAAIFDEYKRFSGVKMHIADQDFIESFTPNLFEISHSSKSSE